MQLPIGIDDFKELRQGDYLCVDKTLLIQELLDDGTKAFLITRPRRFGKTINMSMIKYFFDVNDAEENRKLFADTLIAQASYGDGLSCMDEQGQYPVVFLTLKGLRASSYDKLMGQFQEIVAGLYDEHDYLLDSDSLSVAEKNQFNKILSRDADYAMLSFSLKALTHYLYRHFDRPVMLLLDEYDTPMHTAYSAEKPFHKPLLDFMSTFLGEAFKGNVALKKGVLTGILRVSLMNLFSGFNSVVVRTVLSTHYGQYFGFTEEEVSKLFSELHKEHDEAKIKAWYNGYVFGGVTMYNPWSIINCFDNQDQLQAYWLETGRHGVLGKALVSSSNFDVFAQLKTLIDGGSITIELDERTIFADIKSNQRALWSLMLFSGYLKAVNVSLNEAGQRHVELAIPNAEVKLGIVDMVQKWSQIGDSGESINDELVKCLTNNNIKGFKNIVQRYILETISHYDFTYDTEERFYHIFLLGMVLGLSRQFIIESNKEAGLGRFDIMLIPKDKTLMGIVLELKSVSVSEAEKYQLKNNELKRLQLMESEAAEALVQIESRQYATKFAQHDIQQFAAIGMAFLGKEVVVKYQVL